MLFTFCALVCCSALHLSPNHEVISVSSSGLPVPADLQIQMFLDKCQMLLNLKGHIMIPKYVMSQKQQGDLQKKWTESGECDYSSTFGHKLIYSFITDWGNNKYNIYISNNLVLIYTDRYSAKKNVGWRFCLLCASYLKLLG